MTEAIKILFTCSEAAPFIKVGGLGDVCGALPGALKALSPKRIDIRVFLPLHSAILQKDFKLKKIKEFSVQTKTDELENTLWVSDEFEIPFYFISNKYIGQSNAIYHADAAEDAFKYLSFCLALPYAAKALGWRPAIFNANDWHAAVSLHLLKSLRKSDPFFAEARSVLIIHNMPYNGWGTQLAMRKLGIKASRDRRMPAWARTTPLEMGISAADKVVAVSRGYAEEILTEPKGCGMSEYMRLLGDKFTGIVNGIDTKSYDPQTDSHIEAHFSPDDLSGKVDCKAALQAEAGLPVDVGIPVFTIVSRLDKQKGIDLALTALASLAGDQPWQLVLLGTGDAELEAQARDLQKAYPQRVAAFIRFDEVLARKLYAGGDMFLMPSLYEPCGLSQMIAMRYGNVPIAHSIGGLRDTIINVGKNDATGFLFQNAEIRTIVKAIKTALKLYTEKAEWKTLQVNGMKKDFSWQNSAEEYLALYKTLLKCRSLKG